MFKRVDRRRKRKEKEERLGLDEDQLGVFGLHHTDSSESESDSSSSDSASTSSSDGPATQSRKKRKREASPTSYDGVGENEDSGPSTYDEEDEQGSSDDGSHPPLTIASALKDPIRPTHPDSDSGTWVCAFCPGKTLKHAAMIKVHEASRIHQRRFERMQELAMKFSPDEYIKNVLANSATGTQHGTGSATLSLRAQKRIAKRAKLKERRKKIKEKKAIAMAVANTKKATKTAGTEPMAGDSDMDEAAHASKRLKAASRDTPGGAKNTHQTSVEAKGRRILTDAGRKHRKETTKAPVSEKSKKRRQMGEESTPAH